MSLAKAPSTPSPLAARFAGETSDMTRDEGIHFNFLLFSLTGIECEMVRYYDIEDILTEHQVGTLSEYPSFLN